MKKNKEDFIANLEERLNLLEKEKRDSVLKKYKTTITKRVKAGEKEEDVIDSFGDIDLLSNNILKDNGIKKTTNTKENSKNIPNSKNFFGDFFVTVKGVVDNITKSDYKNIFLMIGELLLIIVVVSLLKLPFILGRELLLSLYDSMGTGFVSTQSRLTSTLIDLAYIVFAVFIFINLFTTRFQKYIENKKEKKK